MTKRETLMAIRNLLRYRMWLRCYVDRNINTFILDAVIADLRNAIKKKD